MTAMLPPGVTQQTIDSLAKNWNVEGDIVLAAIAATGSRIPGGPAAQIRAIKQPIFHHVNHAAAAKIDFLNENSSPGITNITNGQIPAQTVFALENIGVDLVTGVNRTGTTGIANFQAAAVTSIASLEQKRLIFELSYLRLVSGNEVLGEWPLTMLPYGGGLDCYSTIVAASAGACSSAYSVNGAPFAGNRRLFAEAAHLLPASAPISASIFIPTATVATLPNSDVGFWKLALYGTFFRK